MSEPKAISDLIDAQIREQGVSVIRVNDGHVFTFTEALLEELLKLARIKGEVILFIHESVEQAAAQGAQA